jgi:imidazolonepropionase-like amidohydrolase
MSIKHSGSAILSTLASLALLAAAGAALAQDAPRTLFINVHVFDGVQEQRIENANVLVEGNLIKTVSTDPIEAHGATVIDGGGRTLMPGLIDAHWHMFNPLTIQDVMTAHLAYNHAKIAVEAEKTLLRGFTTIHEPGGNSFGLKRAIDEGILVGPRILPSGAPISQTSGHFDFAQPWEPPKRLGGQPSRPERYGMLRVVDGADDALAAARFNLKHGTDFLFDPASNGVQASQLARFGKWLSNAEMLRLITSENARLLELSGERHPYREGPLGVIREGAYADILLVDGNPLDDVSILGDGGKNFPLIMKNGAISKNTL